MHATFDCGARGGRGIGFARQKEADRGEMVRRRLQIDAREFAQEQLARRLTEDARAVTRSAVGRARATMHHRTRGTECEANGLVSRRPAQVRDKADAAGVVFFRYTRLEIIHGSMTLEHI